MKYNNMGGGSFPVNMPAFISYFSFWAQIIRSWGIDTKLTLAQQPVSGSLLAQMSLRVMQKTLLWVICPFSTWVISARRTVSSHLQFYYELVWLHSCGKVTWTKELACFFSGMSFSCEIFRLICCIKCFSFIPLSYELLPVIPCYENGVL